MQLELYENLIQLNPNASDALSNYGLLLKDLGELDKAEVMLRRSISINPTPPNALFNLGLILIRTKPEDSKKFFTKR